MANYLNDSVLSALGCNCSTAMVAEQDANRGRLAATMRVWRTLINRVTQQLIRN